MEKKKTTTLPPTVFVPSANRRCVILSQAPDEAGPLTQLGGRFSERLKSRRRRGKKKEEEGGGGRGGGGSCIEANSGPITKTLQLVRLRCERLLFWLVATFFWRFSGDKTRHGVTQARGETQLCEAQQDDGLNNTEIRQIIRAALENHIREPNLGHQREAPEVSSEVKFETCQNLVGPQANTSTAAQHCLPQQQKQGLCSPDCRVLKPFFFFITPLKTTVSQTHDTRAPISNTFIYQSRTYCVVQTRGPLRHAAWSHIYISTCGRAHFPTAALIATAP